jgi:hypothetical protein
MAHLSVKTPHLGFEPHIRHYNSVSWKTYSHPIGRVYIIDSTTLSVCRITQRPIFPYNWRVPHWKPPWTERSNQDTTPELTRRDWGKNVKPNQNESCPYWNRHQTDVCWGVYATAARSVPGLGKTAHRKLYNPYTSAHVYGNYIDVSRMGGEQRTSKRCRKCIHNFTRITLTLRDYLGNDGY